MQANDPSVSLKYSPSDFFYLNAGEDMPSGEYGCLNVASNNPRLRCANSSSKSLADWRVCYQLELCKNKDLVSWLHEHQNKHGESVVNTMDMQSQYVYEIVDMINLCVGTALVFFYIYYNK
jgi:hypothetical protein